MTRLGVGFALLVILSTAGVQGLGRYVLVQQGRLMTLGGLLLLGLVLLIVKYRAYMEPATPEQILEFHRNPHFWGSLFLLCSIVVGVALPIIHPLKQMTVAAKAPAPPIVEPAPEPPPEPVFPELDVSGVTLNGPRSTALINKRTIMLGERIAGVKLVMVTSSNITVELSGHTRHYGL